MPRAQCRCRRDRVFISSTSGGLARRAAACMLIASMLLGLTSVPALAEAPANEHFLRTWARTDQLVQEGAVARTWMWGPEALTPALDELWVNEDGFEGARQVQYFDKSRMEITNPDGDTSSPWYVTNGLLVVEMITGRMQIGLDGFLPLEASRLPIAGDRDHMSDYYSPRYSDLAAFLTQESHEEGEVIDSAYWWYGIPPGYSGQIGFQLEDDREDLAAYGIRATHFVPETNHRIAEPFWTFMNSQGMVYENGVSVEDDLFLNPYYATGYPITEANWVRVQVAGTPHDVLLQCFERRCLTYTPDNPAGWQVESGNVGQHYYQWRYEMHPLIYAETGEILLSLDGSLVNVNRGTIEPVVDAANGIHFSDPAWSTDGQRIAAVGVDENDVSSIYLMDRFGANLMPITGGATSYSDPAWSPDGSRIAYTWLEPGGTPQVRVIDINTLEIENVDVGQNPAWSPDGDMLVYDQLTSVWVTGSSGGAEPVLIHSVTSFDYITGTSWSPDGMQIAVGNAGNAAEGIPSEITIITPTGEIQASFEPIPGRGVNEPRWLASSDRIAFTDGPVVYSTGIDGSGTRAAVWNFSADLALLDYDWFIAEQPF